MALFGRDYYDESYRGGNWSDRSHWGRSGTPMRPNEGGYYGGSATRDRGWGNQDRYDTHRYARDYETMQGGAYGYGGYDRGYKSRWETDNGDPFGDRQQHTPMRVIRGEARGYDAGFRSGGYDRPYRGSGYPMGYQPYAARTGYDTGYRNRYRGFDRGADRGWF